MEKGDPNIIKNIESITRYIIYLLMIGMKKKITFKVAIFQHGRRPLVDP